MLWFSIPHLRITMLVTRQRLRQYMLDAWLDGEWDEVCACSQALGTYSSSTYNTNAFIATM